MNAIIGFSFLSGLYLELEIRHNYSYSLHRLAVQYYVWVDCVQDYLNNALKLKCLRNTLNNLKEHFKNNFEVQNYLDNIALKSITCDYNTHIV